MRLTTRLMQLASWLLLHRAVKEGEMTLTQANREKTKVKLSAADPGPEDMISQTAAAVAGFDFALDEPAVAGAPARQSRSTRPSADRAPIGNPLVPQLNRLKAAFEQ